MCAVSALLVIVGRWVVATFALVHLAVASQVRDDGEVATAAIYVTGECYEFRQWNASKKSPERFDVRFSPVWLYMCV